MTALMSVRWRAVVRGVALTALMALVFYASAHLSTFWTSGGRSSSWLYPGAGGALAALILVGPRYWPAVALGRLLAFLFAGTTLTLPVMIAVSAANALAAAGGAWVVHRWSDDAPGLTALRDVLLVALAGAVAAALGATVGGATLLLAGSSTPLSQLWANWFMGSLGGALVFAPIVLAWGTGEPLPRSAGYWTHLTLCVAATTVVSVVVFFGSAATAGRTWLVFPPLLWGALAFGVRGATLALLPATLLGVAGTSMGAGVLGHTADPYVRGMLLQQFVAVASFTALVLAVVADERRGKEAIADRERRLQLALAAARSFGFDYDARTGVVPRTPECAEILGLPPETAQRALPEEYLQHVHPDDRPRFAAALRRLTPAAPSGRLTYRFVGSDGRVRCLEDSAMAEFDANGQLARIVGVSVDVTERNVAERERERLLERERAARTEAERATLLRDEFLGTVSHELRTPLNAILGWAQILQSGPRTADALQSGLATIARNARLQTQLIDDLLDLSRLSAGHLRLETAPVDLCAVLRDAVLALTPAATAKGLQVQQIGFPSGLTVSGDADRLQQVFWNLLMNAVKFTPAGGSILVQVENAGGMCRVRVSDTGQGIAPDFLPHVFDRFRQADGSTTRRHSGLGIGLALVRQLVQLHGGTVTAESRGLGLGATFVVEIPTLKIDAVLARLPGGTHAVTGGRSDGTPPTVLVVDDDPDAREVAALILEGAAARVLTAASAGEGLEILSRERPDVIVADIGMPDVDGYDFIRAVRRDADARIAATPAAAVTALARAEDRRRALEAGFQLHLPKPITRDALLAVVNRLQRVRNPA